MFSGNVFHWNFPTHGSRYSPITTISKPTGPALGRYSIGDFKISSKAAVAHSTPEEFTSRRMVVERMDIFDLLEVSEIFASLIETIPNEECFAFGAARIQHQLIMENVLPRQDLLHSTKGGMEGIYNQPHPSLHSNSEIENAWNNSLNYGGISLITR